MFLTNRILLSVTIFLRRVSGLARPALARPVFALHELDAALDERLVRVGAGELELDVAVVLEYIEMG